MIAIAVNRDGAHPLRRAAYRYDAVGGDEASAQESLCRRRDSAPPIIGILFRAAAGEEVELGLLKLVTDNFAVRGNQSDFGPACAEIDGKDVLGALRYHS